MGSFGLSVGESGSHATGSRRAPTVRYGCPVSSEQSPKDGPPIPIDRRQFWRALRARHPLFRVALVEDARMTALHRGERHEFRSRLDAAAQILRLAWVSDAFLAQALYRAKARLQARGVPILPRLFHRLAMAIAQISIGDPVVIGPGVYIIHGQFVADGLVEISSGAVIGPFVTIGLRAGNVRGATIERDVSIGTGAKVIGDVRIGAGAVVGANAVVVSDVPAAATVVGAPARPLGGGRIDVGD
jgi:serine O-acetyltransferase